MKNNPKNKKFYQREARLKRFKSIKKMIDLVKVAQNLAPTYPVDAFVLNPFDRKKKKNEYL